MKHIKTTSVVLVVAFALAMVGAGAVSATALCTSNGSTAKCPEADKRGVGSLVKATLNSESSVLQAGFATIICTKSEVAGAITNAGGSGKDVLAANSTLDFSECGAATVTVLNNGSLAFKQTAGTFNGTISVSGVSVKVKVGATECTYGGNITSGIGVTGGNPAKATATEAPIAKTGGGILCANPSKWSAVYEVTAPNPAYLTAE